MQKVIRGFYSMANMAAWISYLALAAIVLSVFVDVLGRDLLRRSLLGSYELVPLFMTVFGGFGMAYTAVKWGHVSIDLITARSSKTVQNVMQRVTSFVGCAIWGAMAYEVVRHALTYWSATSATLGIPFAPFRFALALGTFLFSLVLLVQTIEAKHESKGEIQE